MRHSQPRWATWGSFCLVGVVVQVGGGIAPASAASDNEGARRQVIEEIVVMARQRAESLQDAPVALTAISGDTIERLALNDLDQLATQVPGMTATYGGPSGAASIYLRGIGTSGGSAGFSTAVGIVIDGQYFSRTRWIQPGMFDVQQVEVLKGPQALYFGKNNTAGLIILQSKEPGEVLEGHARAGYETEAEEMSIEGAISIPLSDTLGIRLAAKTSEMDGWMKNNAGPGVDPLGFTLPGASYSRLPQEEETIARMTLRWTPNDQFEALFKATVHDQESAGVNFATQLIECFGPGGTPQPALRVIPEPYAECNLDFTTAQGGFSEEFLALEGKEFADAAGPRGAQTADWESLMMSLQLNYEFENVTLSTVTGFQKFDTEDIGSFTFDSAGSLPAYQVNEYEAFSQEVRFVTTFDQPVNFMGGFLYAVDDHFYRTSSRVAIFPPSANGRRFSWDRPSTTERDTWSVFGEVVWDVTDAIEISAGARYTNEEMDAGMGLTYVHDIFDAIDYLNEEPFSLTEEYTNVSPQVTVTWRPTDSVTLYGAYKEGFKSGGFDSSNTLNAGVSGEDILFDEETAEGFELGAKTVLFGNSMTLNGTIYRYEFKDLQVQTFDASVIAFLTRNAAESRATGAEVDFQWLAREDLALRGALAYNKAEYEKFLTSCYAGQTQEQGCNIGSVNGGPANQTDLAGEQLPLAPEWVAKLGVTYDLRLGSNWTAEFNIDTTYSDDYVVGLGGLVRQDSYFLVDASIRLVDASDKWEIALIGRNLDNEPILVAAGDRPLTGGPAGLPASDPLAGQRADLTGTVQRGRQVWLQGTYRFR